MFWIVTLLLEKTKTHMQGSNGFIVYNELPNERVCSAELSYLFSIFHVIVNEKNLHIRSIFVYSSPLVYKGVQSIQKRTSW